VKSKKAEKEGKRAENKENSGQFRTTAVSRITDGKRKGSRKEAPEERTRKENLGKKRYVPSIANCRDHREAAPGKREAKREVG